MFLKFVSCCVASCFFALSLPNVVFASDNGQIMGFVVDSAGRPVPGVTIRVWDGEKGLTVKSDIKGEYMVRDLDSRKAVDLSWDKKGSASGSVEGLRVPADSTLYVMTGYLSGEVGETLTFRIPSNPSTGYSWTLFEEGDLSVVTPVGNIMESKDHLKDSRGTVGAGGYELWMFRGTREGSSTVALGYLRSWETDVSPSRIAVTILSVK